MKIDYTHRALDTIEDLPPIVRKAFFKQVKFLEAGLRHPSLRAKKFYGTDDVWQARVNDDWRFYFQVVRDTFIIFKIIPPPK